MDTIQEKIKNKVFEKVSFDFDIKNKNFENCKFVNCMFDAINIEGTMFAN